MGSKKLVYCCIAGILLGFLIPLIFHTELYSTLMFGMVCGLGAGYILDKRDEEQGKKESRAFANRKAAEANRLMERARKGLENEYLRMDHDEDDLSVSDEEEEAIEEYESGEEEAGYDADEEEQAQKLNEAEELLRAARERIREK